MTAPTATRGGVYQGYPYSNPIVLDAPSIDAATASRWANLPRNPIVPIQRPRDTPESNITNVKSPKLDKETKSPDVEPDPRVYIDFPTNELGEYIGDTDGTEDNRREDSRTEDAPSNFVEDTIFYDPFEDRRINVGQSSQTTNPGSGADRPIPGVSSPSTQAGGSGLDATSPSIRVPPYMTKESNIYGSPQSVDDRFSSSTHGQQFPEPPPAYTEVDRSPVQTPPPRTEVIVPDAPNRTGLANPDRKLLLCQFCGQRVYTLAINENGALTHVLAGFFMIAFAPLTLIVYCTDYFKYRNHYCPNCNRLIGYEVPSLCQDMVYTKAD